MRCIFKRKNVDKVQRNGQTPESKTIVKYITQTGTNGVDGADSYQVVISPNNKTFTAGSYNAVQQDYEVMVYAYRGTAQINALVNDASITGTIAGALDVSIESGSNGTDHTKLILHVKENLVADAGELKIPVQYNVDSTDASSNYIASEWDPETNSLATYEAIYSWTLGKTGQSQYNLDLSNESATINADSSGNIDSSAARPPCKATLSFGADNNLSGVTYAISCNPNSVVGLDVDPDTGWLYYDTGGDYFNFGTPDASGLNTADTVLNVTFIATHDSKTFRKTMTIEKALPGQQGPAGYTPYIGENGNWWINGEDTGVKAEATDGSTGADAVSRWIDLSADQIKIDASNNVVPPSITATAWKQVGGNTPTTDPSCNIKWFPDSSTERAYTGPIDVSANWNYLTFKLYFGNVYIGETETVPILKDGKQGEQGIRGAAVRGPILWDSSVSTISRIDASTWFYCGEQTHFGPNPPARPQESEFIDIILHDGQYYRCIDNYEQTPNATWTSTMADGKTVAQHWTAADSSYEFVAANLLLAKNAKINFLTNNELYLVDGSGNITGGAAGGTGINFWAGHQNPSSAPFQINYDGTMTATKGQFGCLEIGQDSAGRSVLTGEGTYDGTTTELTLSPTYFTMDASSNKVIVSPGGNPNANGIIHIDSSADIIDMWADGIVKAGSLETMTTSSPGNIIPGSGGINNGAVGGAAVITPGLFNLEVAFVLSSNITPNSVFDGSTGATWKFHGIDTRVPVASYPNLTIYSTAGQYYGYFCFTNYTNYVITSVLSETATKKNNVIYITL